MEGIFDEVAPGLRNALGAVEAPAGNAREDLYQGVFGELASHRAPLAVGAVHAAAAAAHRWERGRKLRRAAMSADAMPERHAEGRAANLWLGWTDDGCAGRWFLPRSWKRRGMGITGGGSNGE